MMLHQFLATHRAELIERSRSKAGLRSPGVSTRRLQDGIAPFLDQLVWTLQMEWTAHPLRGRKVPRPAGGATACSEIVGAATAHGRELARNGASIEDVVHDYGDLGKAISDLASEREAVIDPDELQAMHRCLHGAIAAAVTAFARQHDTQCKDKNSQDAARRLGVFAHELRNLLTTATLAVNIVKTADVGLRGPTGQILDRSLLGMRTLIDRSLAEARTESGKVVEPHALARTSASPGAGLEKGLE